MQMRKCNNPVSSPDQTNPSNRNSENPPKKQPDQYPRANHDPRNLEHSNRIALFRHARKPARAPLDVCREGGKDLSLFGWGKNVLAILISFRIYGVLKRSGRESHRVIECILVSGIIVDVDCDVFQGGDFAGEGVEEVVVLSAEEC